MKRYGNIGKYTALISIILVFAMSLGFSMHALVSQNKAEKRVLSNVQWTAANLEFEYQRFLNALNLYAHDDAKTDKAQLERRLDVLWSRIPLLLEGEIGVFFGTVEGVHETVSALQVALTDLDPQIRNLAREDLVSYRALRKDLEAYRESIYEVTLASFLTTDSQSATYDQGLNNAYLLLVKSLIGILLSGSLITVFLVLEVRRAQRAVADALEARRQSEQANRAKSDFLAHMSHELRTPLNAIIGFSTIIERAMLGPLNNERYREYGKDISSSGTHLLSLINDILDLSRIEAGKFELDETDIDVGEAVRASVHLVRDRAAAGRIMLKEIVPAQLPHLHADDRAIKQILLNLLSNAVRYTLEGGRVSLRVSLERDGRFCITITDTGVGMTPEDLAKALTPFQQGGNLLTRKHHGTGLGLSLANHLAELHGGQLAIDSTPGKGTAVTVILPSWRVRHEPLAA